MRHYLHNKIVSNQHRTNIALVGVGGTGSHVLAGLGQIHQGLLGLEQAGLHVSVFDDDIVSESNIGRQAFAKSDIGQAKASVLVSRVNGWYGTDWDAYPFQYPHHAICTNADIVISCVDTAAARIKIASHLKRCHNALYWLDFGNAASTGQVILGSLQEIPQPESSFETTTILPTIVDLYPQIETFDEEQNIPSCSVRESLFKQDLFVNSTLANFGCNLLWTLFKNSFTEISGFFMDIHSGTTNPVPLSKSYWQRCGFNHTATN